MSKIAVIGSGFSGLSASAYLAAAGHEVFVFEKNAQAGGRATQFTTDSGYVYDMGPSWYWMPNVFEHFFNDFGYTVSDFYTLKLLNPSFDIVFGKDDQISVPADFEELCSLFESLEKGSALKLRKFMEEAAYKYYTGVENLAQKPGLSVAEFADMSLVKGILRLQVFSSLSKHVKKYFSHPKLVALMEFPALFLGAMPEDIPALYSLMNYAGLKLGTWYPIGGFGKVIDSMKQVAEQKGVTFLFNSAVQKIEVENNQVTGIWANGELFKCDAVVASADYHHVESKLLAKEYRNYDETYWAQKTFAPSCLIFYLGVRKLIPSLQHHTLFFDEDITVHSKEIYRQRKWPTNPLFYVCCPSKTDDGVAPKGHENLFLLMPIAPGLEDNEATREQYFQVMMERIKKHTGEDLQPLIEYKKSYCVNDFVADYNSYKGNAYGLANTLMQTAILKPKIKNKKIDNLFYTGQLTVPGPGVPPSIISGKIVAQELMKHLKSIHHEVAI